MDTRARTATGVGMAALVALAGLPATAAAQEPLDVAVLNQGKVRVTAVTGGEKAEIAETDDEGRATVPVDVLNLGKGTPVAVELASCEGETEVVLVPEGEPGSTCGRAGEEDGCGCERLGVIAWGETTSVTIEATGAGGTMTTGGAPAASGSAGAASSGVQAGGGRLGVRLGFDVGGAYWTEMEDAVCGRPGLGACEADETSLVLSPWVELRPTSLPLYLGVGGFYSSLSYTQELDDMVAPTRVEGDLDATGADLYVRGFLPPEGSLSPWVMGGAHGSGTT
ncbi:MAG: hypothetical protein ACOC83_06690 [Gemmatimonadota bacterium]